MGFTYVSSYVHRLLPSSLVELLPKLGGEEGGVAHRAEGDGGDNGERVLLHQEHHHR